LNAIEARF